jgi:hypothetical protein
VERHILQNRKEILMAALWAIAAISVGSSLLGSSGDDKSWKGEADKQGINTAAVQFQTARNFEALPQKARAIEAAAALNNVSIARTAAAAEADALVSAAAAGSAGGSVDATVDDVTRSADEARTQVETARLGQQAQIEQDRADIFWEGDAAKYQYKYTGGGKAGIGERALAAGLAGAGAYFGAII